MEKMIILRRQDRLWLLLRRGLEAEKWQPVFHSFIMKTFAEPKPAMRSLRHSQSGIFHLSTLLIFAYEAATADLNDVNMIDPFHLEAYGKTTVNYNRDIEIFPVLNAIFEGFTVKIPITNRRLIWE